MLPRDILAEAQQQAERSEPAVRAAALLHIARVQTAFDPDRARRTFEQALAETRQLGGMDGDFLLAQSRLLAAAVAPDLLPEIPSVDHVPRRIFSESLGKIMLEHQHQDAAFEYVIHYDEPSSFPFSVALAVMQSPGDDERRLAVLRRAIDAWRAAPEGHFIRLFQSQWKVLPLEEAGAVTREIVRTTLSQPDRPIRATYDQERTTQITSTRQHTLFQILHILRQVDGPLAESLIADHKQLAAAARRFPNGMESVMQEAEARRVDRSPSGSSGGYVMAGSRSDFPFFRSLMQGSQDGDFGPSIDHALERYRDDTAPERPNQAPKEFWPSTWSFRSTLYKAGKRLGHDALVYLERIPDADLRLFAQIELAAAWAGLPELPGVQRQYGTTV